VGGEPGVEDERGEEQCGAEGGDFDCAADGHGIGSDGEFAEWVVPCWLGFRGAGSPFWLVFACESGKKNDVVMILVAQAILRVPQVDCGFACSKRGRKRTRWVDLVWCGAIVLLARAGTACRAPTEETATAKGTMSRGAPSIGDLRRAAAWGTGPSVLRVNPSFLRAGRNACATKGRRQRRRPDASGTNDNGRENGAHTRDKELSRVCVIARGRGQVCRRVGMLASAR
jgi:hypothetical protein